MPARNRVNRSSGRHVEFVDGRLDKRVWGDFDVEVK